MANGPVCAACGYNPADYVQFVGEIVLPTALESNNSIGANRGRNRWKYRKVRDNYYQLIQRALPIPQATGKRQLWIIREYGKGKRAYDLDNLYGGCKPLLDCLVGAGYLQDDKPACCQLIVQQGPSPTGADRIRLRFIDV